MSFDLKLINNNLAINPDGSLQTVRDNQKLIQDVAKIILTALGSHKIFRWYGSSLKNSLIGEILTESEINVEVNKSIQDSLNNLIALQQSQSRVQYVSAGEIIAAINDISVLRDPDDPRKYDISVYILTRQLTVVEESFQLII
jgi:hypothetical protein